MHGMAVAVYISSSPMCYHTVVSLIHFSFDFSLKLLLLSMLFCAQNGQSIFPTVALKVLPAPLGNATCCSMEIKVQNTLCNYKTSE